MSATPIHRAPDTPAARLLARGWAAMVEELVLRWKVQPDGVTRDELLDEVWGTDVAPPARTVWYPNTFRTL